MEVVILTSPTYGDVNWRKIGTISAFTFDAENEEEFKAFDAIHPTKHFQALSVKQIKPGIFEVWLPLAYDNKDWKFPKRSFHGDKTPTQLPIAIPNKKVLTWFKKAEQFMTEVSDIIDVLYDEEEGKN